MRKILAMLFARLANWLDSASFAAEYNQYRYQLIAEDCRRLKKIGFWIENHYNSSKYREALLEKPEVDYSENIFPQAESDFSEADVASDLDERDLDDFISQSDYEANKNNPVFEEPLTLLPPLKEYYKPLEPFESAELLDLNRSFECLRLALNQYQIQSDKLNALLQISPSATIRLVDNIEAMVRGDLSIHLKCDDLNRSFEFLRLALNQYQIQSDRLEELSQSFSRKTIRFLNGIEGAARGDLTSYVKTYIRFGELGAIANALNPIIENFRNDIRSLPEDHPLRVKYKT